MKICQRCIMDESVPDFEETISGCNFCDFYFDYYRANFRYNLEEQINNIKVETAMKGRKYDAIMGISGGYDSSTALYNVHKLGLNVLVVHADNFYNKKVTEGNIEALIMHTGFELRRIKVNKEEFIEVQKAVLKSGVINVEAVSDLLIQTSIYRTAKEEGIPYVIEGSNITTEALRVPKWGYRNDDKRNLNRIWKKFGDGSKAFKNLKLMNIWEKNKLISKLTIIRPLNYFNYNPDSMKEFLIKWVDGYRDYGGKHEESIITDFYQRYILPKKFGIDKRLVFLANRVCAGHITREEAFEILEEPFYKDDENLSEQLHYIAKLFNISTAYLVHLIFNSPPTAHEKYGTDKVLRFLSNIRFKWKQALEKVFFE